MLLLLGGTFQDVYFIVIILIVGNGTSKLLNIMETDGSVAVVEPSLRLAEAKLTSTPVLSGFRVEKLTGCLLKHYRMNIITPV